MQSTLSKLGNGDSLVILKISDASSNWPHLISLSKTSVWLPTIEWTPFSEAYLRNISFSMPSETPRTIELMDSIVFKQSIILSSTENPDL